MKNKDLIFTSLNKLWRIVSGPLTVVLIPLFLTPQLQGYWFTILGLSFLMIFADLGFFNIVLVFAAHEFAFLRFDDKLGIVGSEEHLKRLGSFFVFSVKWAVFAMLVALPAIALFSFFILSRRVSGVEWILPWAIYLFGSILVYFNNFFLSFFEGCNSVAKTQKIRLQISMVLSVVMWGGLALGLNLQALSLSLVAGAVFGAVVLFYTFRLAIKSMLKVLPGYKQVWSDSFFPLLWRYAVSFASGYFIFQLYTPLMFYYHGPVEAGRVGISIALWTAVHGVASIWIYVLTPQINIHISRREWHILDPIFFRHLFLTIGTFFFGALAFFLLFFVLGVRVALFAGFLNRFVGFLPMLLLAVSWFFQTIVNALAVYLRAHKQEPLMLPSLLSAIYITIATFLCARYLSPEFFFLGFLSSYFWGLPWVLAIFHKKLKEISVNYG